MFCLFLLPQMDECLSQTLQQRRLRIDSWDGFPFFQVCHTHRAAEHMMTMSTHHHVDEHIRWLLDMHGTVASAHKLNSIIHRIAWRTASSFFALFWVIVIVASQNIHWSAKCKMHRESNMNLNRWEKCVHTTLELLLLVNENFLNYGAFLHNFKSLLFFSFTKIEKHIVSHQPTTSQTNSHFWACPNSQN